ncbi:hypothetical protein LguiA_025146 [Lonicera macranthoides]
MVFKGMLCGPTKPSQGNYLGRRSDSCKRRMPMLGRSKFSMYVLSPSLCFSLHINNTYTHRPLFLAGEMAKREPTAKLQLYPQKISRDVRCDISTVKKLTMSTKNGQLQQKC